VENGVWAGQFPPKFSKLLYIATIYVYQVKMELEKRDLQCFPEWGGTALSEFWEEEEERISCRWVKSLLNLLLFLIYNTV